MTQERRPVPSDPVLFVSHTHWDREWYRTFEVFRARLVDTVDRVLELLAGDPGWKFQFDVQTIVVEDYLQIRPDRRAELVSGVGSGRVAIGPWYVQPDCLLPAGETHIRNLLEGRRVAESLGGGAQVAYVADSFGHPAQFPQLFAGFGLGPFVYARGNGGELDWLGPVYRWVAPDGSGVVAYHLTRGYSCAGNLPADPDIAAEDLAGVIDSMRAPRGSPVTLMNGSDHTLPDANTAAVTDALAARIDRVVRRGLLDELRTSIDETELDEYRGDLLGGRVENLLPGVWSARMPIKQASRRAERELLGWAEPWVALGSAFALPDERPALREAWRALLANQAHDSICGCSQDEVHRQVPARFATATELGRETATRVLERLAGLGPDRRVPWSTELDIAVYNPSPTARTDVVQVALDGFPMLRVSAAGPDVHPLSLGAGLVTGYTADGEPARIVPAVNPARVRVFEGWPAWDIELVVRDVPAFGWRRIHLAPGDHCPDVLDDGHEISAGPVAVRADDDGTLTVRFGAREFTGLGALEDTGDRGDAYDYDTVPDDPGARVTSVDVHRRRHPSGIERLVITRVLDVPAELAPNRAARSTERRSMTVVLEARVMPAVDRVDLHVEVENTAKDHRLRILFPTATPTTGFRAATTFDVANRSTAPPDDSGWLHSAPRTFPHHGWVETHGLTVAAPGLPEAEVSVDGTIAITLIRAVAWMARLDLASRPVPCAPGIPTPEAQCLGSFVGDLSLRLDGEPSVLVADELGLRAVPAGDAPLLPAGSSLCVLEPGTLVLSAFKPADDHGLIVRVLNPTDEPGSATLIFGIPVTGASSVHLDESPDDKEVALEGWRVRFPVGAHALRTIKVTTGAPT